VVAPPAWAATTGANLIVGGDAEAGVCTTDWHAATTMPDWTVTANSPDVMCYSPASALTGGWSGHRVA
jgi:hypothetical protein